MKQHVKAVIWPRGPMDGKVKRKGKQPIYRYTVIGLIVTDEPIPEFEGKNEILLDGPVNELVEPLTKIKSRKPKIKVGDATSVLLELDII
jgi:hypothetical protein